MDRRPWWCRGVAEGAFDEPDPVRPVSTVGEAAFEVEAAAGSLVSSTTIAATAMPPPSAVARVTRLTVRRPRSRTRAAC